MARGRKQRRRNTRCGASERPRIDTISRDEIDALIERAQAGQLTEHDVDRLRVTFDTIEWLTDELAAKGMTIARLRALFGISTSEKKRDVLGEDSQDKPGAAAAAGQTESDGSASVEPAGASAEQSESKPKRAGHGRNGAEEYTGAEEIKVPHESLNPGDACPGCKSGKVYRRTDRPRVLIRVTGQPPLKATRWVLDTMRCNLCGNEFVADPPAGVGDERYDETAAAMIGMLRYGSGMPMNRLNRLERNLGIPLPASTQWEIVRDAAELLQPVYLELIEQAAQGELHHNDDTTMKVLELDARNKANSKAGKKERTGSFTTAVVSQLIERSRRIALFFTGRNHAGENLARVLERRSEDLKRPMQMSDGLDRNVPKGVATAVANCILHARRNFVRLVESFPDHCRRVIEDIGQVYLHDAATREQAMSPAQRLAYHKQHSKPVLDELKGWMQTEITEKRIEPNSNLGQAIGYMLKRWSKLTLFLRRKGAPLDNNTAERALKRAIIHRKNSLFYRTLRGAQVGDVFMSLIYTAELTGANPFEYLVALLKHPEEVAANAGDWLPWNYDAARAVMTSGP